MKLVQFDREEVAFKALCYFRGRIKHKINYSDKEWLEGQANISITKAINGFDPDRGMQPFSWCVRRLTWDIRSALKAQIRRMKSRKEVHFSSLDSLDSVVPTVESKAEAKMLAKEIESMIHRRPVSDRDAGIVKDFLSGLSKTELAKKYQMSLQMVTNVLHKFLEMAVCGSHLVRKKECWECLETKEFSSFRRDKRSKDGLHDRCSNCAAKAKAKRKRKQLVFDDGRICSMCGVMKGFDSFSKVNGVNRAPQLARCKECCSRVASEFQEKKKTKRYCITCKEWKLKSVFGPSFKLRGQDRFKCLQCEESSQ